MLSKKNLMVILGMSIGLAATFAAADARSDDIATLIPDASDVASTTVVLTPSGLMTRAPLTEKQLLGFGCNITRDSETIADLIGVMKNNLQDDKGEVGQFYVRHAIYLNLKNGATIRYIFSDAIDRDKQVLGRADNGSPGSTASFLAHGALLADLRSWLLDDSVEKKDATWCVKNR